MRQHILALEDLPEDDDATVGGGEALVPAVLVDALVLHRHGPVVAGAHVSLVPPHCCHQACKLFNIII